MKKSKPRRILITLIAILATLFFVTKSYWDYLLSPLDAGQTATQSFSIPKGQSSTDIADRLEKEGLIRSSLAFKAYLRQSAFRGKLQAGEFRLSPSMSTERIVRELTTGTNDRKVTLVEGWRVEEIAEKLYKELGASKEEFLKASKEGYMFPDTYMFDQDTPASDIAAVMKETFDRKYTKDLQSRISRLGLTSDEGVILASIVEREARSSGERVKVASVLLKRLEIGMAINADATVQYALGYQAGEGGWWKRRLTFDDLKFESPFNTYLNPGLPPAPICNPSLSSLEAVANADPATPYLYYYHDSQGRSYYSSTLEEHNQNVAEHP